MRRTAIVALRRIGSPSVIEFIIEAINDDEAIVRKEAINSLFLLRGEAALPHIQAGLSDQAVDVRIITAHCFQSIGTTKALSILEVSARQRSWREIDVVHELQQNPTIINLTYALRNAPLRIREYAAQLFASSLTLQGEERNVALEALVQALKDRSKFVRRSAIKTLLRVGDEAITKPLITALKDRDEFVVECALEGLHRIGTPEALAAVEAWRREQGEK